MVVIPAPFPDVSVHVVQSPGIGRIAADVAGAAGRANATVHRLGCEVGLLPGYQSPKDVAVDVPARQAYSHCASVGTLNSQPPAGLPSDARCD